MSRLTVSHASTNAPSQMVAVLEEVRDIRLAGDPAAWRRIRAEAGLRQSHVSRLLGIPTITLQCWELGRRTPTGPAAQRYARLLDYLQKFTAGLADVLEPAA